MNHPNSISCTRSATNERSLINAMSTRLLFFLLLVLLLFYQIDFNLAQTTTNSYTNTHIKDRAESFEHFTKGHHSVGWPEVQTFRHENSNKNYHRLVKEKEKEDQIHLQLQQNEQHNEFDDIDNELLWTWNDEDGQSGCQCWNTTADGTSEVECKCQGPKLEKLPENMPSDVYRITVTEAPNFISIQNEDIRPYAFALGEIILSELPKFREIKNGTFLGMRNLNTIYISGAPDLTYLPGKVFNVYLPKLKLVRITSTGLTNVPNLSLLKTQYHLHMVDLENNKINRIDSNTFTNLKVEHLALSYNNIEEIGAYAFNGSVIARLTLKGNSRLSRLHQRSFMGIESLRQLDLSQTSITQLPTQGLSNLEILRLEKVTTLTVIPSIYHFRVLEEAHMTFPYHCCAFLNPESHDPVQYQKFKEFEKSVGENCGSTSNEISTSSTNPPSIDAFSSTAIIASNYNSDDVKGKRRFIRRSGAEGDESFSFPKIIIVKNGVNKGSEQAGGKRWNNIFISNVNATKPKRSSQGQVEKDLGTYIGIGSNSLFGSGSSSLHEPQGNFQGLEDSWHHSSVTLPTSMVQTCGNVTSWKLKKIKCYPQPDAFSPCEDIMGNIVLRGAVWIVIGLALFGNTAVLVVLLLAPGRMSVQRFLISNLAFADLVMGVYLLMVATEDLVSLGVYFNYAIEWQLGWGCQFAGFLTVFSSELSVFTLCIITGERWYALTRAMHLTKRLTLVGASQLMSIGWLLAIILALLPLIGVSSYSKTSICLPMEANSLVAQGYLAFLLLFNGIAFILVAIAYICMWQAVASHGSNPASTPASTASADLAIAKKMAILVFTNFVCWAPVAFFGLTAIGGSPLIGVTDSKILLVFFYPLNSCSNPYLYALLTRQYRRDLLLLLSRHGVCVKTAAKYKTGVAGASTNNTIQTMTMRVAGSLGENKLMNTTSANPTSNGKHKNIQQQQHHGQSAEVLVKLNEIHHGNCTEQNDTCTTTTATTTSISNSDKSHHHVDNPRIDHEFDEEVVETSFISIPSRNHSSSEKPIKNKKKVEIKVTNNDIGSNSGSDGEFFTININKKQAKRTKEKDKADKKGFRPIKTTEQVNEVSEITPFCD